MGIRTLNAFTVMRLDILLMNVLRSKVKEFTSKAAVAIDAGRCGTLRKIVRRESLLYLITRTIDFTFNIIKSYF